MYGAEPTFYLSPGGLLKVRVGLPVIVIIHAFARARTLYYPNNLAIRVCIIRV